MKILITYASSYGSTQSVAERLSTRLTSAAPPIGDVTLLPLTKDLDPTPFDVVLIGSCIHARHWLKPARAFLTSHSQYFKENPKPIWAFSVGMPKPGAQEKQEEKDMEKKVRKEVDIRGHKLFQGKWDSKDMRDWEAMDKWADEIVQSLRMDQAGVRGGN
ncbi:Flavodoxin domain-containing protein [Halenospora varia]|nr:Flavodoxin domain-containing protein [Halenospora varia]